MSVAQSSLAALLEPLEILKLEGLFFLDSLKHVHVVIDLNIDLLIGIRESRIQALALLIGDLGVVAVQESEAKDVLIFRLNIILEFL